MQRLLIMSRCAVFPITFAGSGPGDPDMLTLGVLRALQQADVVLHDRLVSPEIIALITGRRIDVGKMGFGHHTPQSDINARLVAEAEKGLRVVRLKAGDPTIFARLDEEIEAIQSAGLDFTILPGITAASAAAAGIGQSLTQRGRNASLRILTGHDVAGFAEHDWRSLAAPGQVAAIYMGKRAARFLQGRLMIFGAAPATPITVVENASRQTQRTLSTTLYDLANTLEEAHLDGPAVILFGLCPREAATSLPAILLEEFA